MSINWQDVVTAFGGQIVLLGAAAWLFKSLVSQRLTQEANEFKIKLQADVDAATERLKNSLQMAATEHQIRFSGLHAKRAEVIAGLYALLWDAHALAMQFILQDNRNADRSATAREKVVELYRYISYNRIYLPKSALELLDRFESLLRKSVSFVDVYYVRIEHPTERTRLEANQVILDAARALESDLPALRERLESEFLVLLEPQSQS
jgi:hypothetical protein